MPRYDYQCPRCGLITEMTVSTLASNETFYCGDCFDLPALIKLPSAPNFVVNGFNAKNGYTK